MNEFESDWISLSQSQSQSGVRVFLSESERRWQGVWIQDGSVNPTWQSSRWLPSSSWVRMNELESDWIRLSQSFMQNGWIQDGRIQDGCHHQVNQIELVWVKVRVEWECFWVNLREENNGSESNMAVAESNMSEFKMAAINKLSENEWLKFLCKCWEPILASVSEFERKY